MRFLLRCRLWVSCRHGIEQSQWKANKLRVADSMYGVTAHLPGDNVQFTNLCIQLRTCSGVRPCATYRVTLSILAQNPELRTLFIVNCTETPVYDDIETVAEVSRTP
jgi:hypothetical protein